MIKEHEYKALGLQNKIKKRRHGLQESSSNVVMKKM